MRTAYPTSLTDGPGTPTVTKCRIDSLLEILQQAVIIFSLTYTNVVAFMFLIRYTELNSPNEEAL